MNNPKFAEPYVRLMKALRYFDNNKPAGGDSWYTMMIGFAVGLALADKYPELSRAVVAELAPPTIDTTITWIAEGSTDEDVYADPTLPIN